MTDEKKSRTLPCFLFHETIEDGKYKDGKMFKTQEELDEALTGPDAAGWHDTPAKFDPNYKAPAVNPDAADLPEEAVARGFVKEHYPSFRFHVDGKTEPKVVKNADEDADLDPAVWKHSPDPKTWTVDEPKTPAKPNPAMSLANQQQGNAPNTDAAADARAAQVAQDQKDAAELHAANADEVIDKIKGQTDKAVLERVRQLEALNPEGPRVTILRAVKASLDKLTA